MTREEALHIVKTTKDWEELHSALQELIPELNESEDERIRKDIIALINFGVSDGSAVSPGSYTKKEEAIDYLERQKEQTPVKLNDDTELGLDRALQIVKDAKGNLCGYQSADGIYECDHAIQTLECILKSGIEQKPVHTAKEMWKEMRLEVYAQASGNRHEPNYSDSSTKMFSLCDIDEIFEKIGNSIVLSQSESWSEEDRSTFNRIVEILVEGSNVQNWWRKERLISKDEMQKLTDRLKFLYNRLDNKLSQTTWNTPEWSDADERQMSNLIKFIETYGSNYYAFVYKVVDWLKSLKSRLIQEWSKEDKKLINYFYSLLGLACEKDIPRWKPSKEQMKWLKDVIETVPMTCRQQVPLESLYADLQKLI